MLQSWAKNDSRHTPAKKAGFLLPKSQRKTPMRTVFADRQSPEYLKRVEDREDRKLFGNDYPDIQWIDRMFVRLKSTPPFHDYTDKDHADLEKAKLILHRLIN